MTYDLWSFRRTVIDQAELQMLAGYRVEATNGALGTVYETTEQDGGSHLVITRGRWMLDRKMVVPAGLIHRIDNGKRTVYLDRDRDEVNKAPRYDHSLGWESTYQQTLGQYYGRAGM